MHLPQLITMNLDFFTPFDQVNEGGFSMPDNQMLASRAPQYLRLSGLHLNILSIALSRWDLTGVKFLAFLPFRGLVFDGILALDQTTTKTSFPNLTIIRFESSPTSLQNDFFDFFETGSLAVIEFTNRRHSAVFNMPHCLDHWTKYCLKHKETFSRLTRLRVDLPSYVDNYPPLFQHFPHVAFLTVDLFMDGECGQLHWLFAPPVQAECPRLIPWLSQLKRLDVIFWRHKSKPRYSRAPARKLNDITLSETLVADELLGVIDSREAVGCPLDEACILSDEDTVSKILKRK
jgi:hypothetical protein